MKLILLTFAAGFWVADATALVVKPSRIAITIIDFVIFRLLEFELTSGTRTLGFLLGVSTSGR